MTPASNFCSHDTRDNAVGQDFPVANDMDEELLLITKLALCISTIGSYLPGPRALLFRRQKMRSPSTW